MPKPKAAEPRDKPLLLRVTAQQREVLESVAHLRGLTPNEYAHQLLVRDLAVQGNEAHVRADLENRRAYRQERGATVTQLRQS